MATRDRVAAATGVFARRAAAFARYSSSMASRRAVHVPLVVGVTLAVAAWIAFAQIRIFPSMLNKCTIAHPWLLSNGFVDYRDVPGQKSPLLPMFLSWLLPLFGGDAALAARTAHVGFITLIVLTATLWVYRHAGVWAWAATALFFLVWSNFFGLWATSYYDVALAPIYLLFFVLLAGQSSRQTDRLSRSSSAGSDPLARPEADQSKEGSAQALDARALAVIGLVQGVAILTKQHAVLLVLPVAILLAWHLFGRRIAVRRFLGLGSVYAAALLLPLAGYVVYYYQQTGSLSDLVYWTVTVNLAGPYGSEAASHPALSHVRDMMPALVMLVPFAGSLLVPATGARPGRTVRALLLVMFGLSTVLLYPRYSPRHWPAAFAFLAMMSGIACADLVHGWKQRKAGGMAWMGAAVVALWVAIAAIIYVPVLQAPQPDTWDEYSDLVDLAADLQGRIPAQGAVALVPLDEGNANLNYLLDRLPPPYWLMNYSWWMNPTVIGRWLEVMEESQPPTVLFFPEGIDLSSSAPAMLEYVETNYQVIDSVQWGDRRQVQIMARLPAPMPSLARVAATLDARTRPGDVVLVAPAAIVDPVATQYQGAAQVIALPATEEELAALAARHARLFLVVGEAASDAIGAQAWLDGHAFRAGHEWIDSAQLVLYGTGRSATAPAVELEARFGSQVVRPIVLDGYDLPAGPWRPGDVLPLTLFWQATGPIGDDYKVFVHVVDANGQIVAQNDAPPAAGLRPTGSWVTGEVVVDAHGIWLGGDSQELAPGEYKLYVGLYLPATGERLVTAGGPTPGGGDRLLLTSIQVAPSKGE